MTEARAPEAIITGASAGIGAALAHKLAAAGYDLVLVARRADRLEALAERMRSEHGRRVSVVALDLTSGDALAALQAISPAPAVLINNAGFGKFGSVLKHTVNESALQVRLNCEALTALTTGYLPRFVERGCGVIVNIASIAAFQPVPYFAVYAASKAFVLSLSEALDEELKGTGVRVVAVCPGPVPTEFQAHAGSPDARDEPDLTRRSPEQIADAVLAAIKRPRRVVTPAGIHGFIHWAQRFVPRGMVLSIAAKKMRKRGV